MEDNNIFDRVERKKDNVINKTKAAFNDYLVYIMLLFVITVQVVSELYTVGVRDIFTVAFFLDLLVSIASTLTVYLMFAPIGSQKEIERNESYRLNIRRWGDLSTKIRAGLNDAFSDFCKKRERIEREDKRRAIIQNNTMIDYNKYISEYLTMKPRDIKKLYDQGELSKDEYIAIKKANGSQRVKPINPLLVLCGVEGLTINDAGRDTSTGFVKWMITRPLFIFASNVALNAIKPAFNGLNTADAVYSMLLSCLGTLIAAYVGYTVGVGNIKKRNDIVKNRIYFIELFEEDKRNNLRA